MAVLEEFLNYSTGLLNLCSLRSKIAQILFFFYLFLLLLVKKRYRMKEKEAKALQDFMMPMLCCLPEKRATAKEMLEHPWLKGPTQPYEYK